MAEMFFVFYSVVESVSGVGAGVMSHARPYKGKCQACYFPLALRLFVFTQRLFFALFSYVSLLRVTPVMSYHKSIHSSCCCPFCFDNRLPATAPPSLHKDYLQFTNTPSFHSCTLTISPSNTLNKYHLSFSNTTTLCLLYNCLFVFDCT